VVGRGLAGQLAHLLLVDAELPLEFLARVRRDDADRKKGSTPSISPCCWSCP
jgi:hypothetical protein